MKRYLRAVLSAAIPKTPKGVAWRAVGCCILMVFWQLVLDGLSGKPEGPDLVERSREIGLLFGPFAVMFLSAIWLQERASAALRRRAYFDQLSGALNRQTFVHQARNAIAESSRGLLLLIDADHFKNVNDMFGHAAGDRCISAIGHRLQWHARDSDITGRLGGEEFGVFLRDVTEQHGRIVATRIGQPVEFTDADKSVHLKVTLSIGAVWTTPDRTLEDLFQEADEALYVAKASGRAQLRFSDSDEVVLLASGKIGKTGEAVTLPERTTSKMNLMLGG